MTPTIQQEIQAWADDPTRSHRSTRAKRMAASVRAVAAAAGWRSGGDITNGSAWTAIQAVAPDAAPLTVADYVHCVNCFSRWWAALNDRSPRIVKLPKNPQIATPRGVFTPDEVRTLIATAEADDRWWLHCIGHERALCYALGAYAGLRANEIRLLTRSCIDMDQNTIWLPHEITKAGKAQSVPMNPKLRDMLARQLDRLKPNPKLPVATLPRSGAYMLRKDMEKAEIPIERWEGGVRTVRDFHSLRHSFVTRLASMNGMDVRTMQDLARHANATTTMRYLHPNDDTAREAIEAIAD